MIITTHKDLRHAISGKTILHLNSLGKDAALTLEWLNHYAANCNIISVFFRLKSGPPSDQGYIDYLKRRYPRTVFIEQLGVPELNEILEGKFQSPIYLNYVINHLDYEHFSFKRICEDMRKNMKADYLCSGMSCYEGMGRAMYLRRVGLLDEKNKTIYPIGLMKQAQVMEAIRSSGLKLNPSYKFASESHDTPNYYKMRRAFIARPEFEKQVARVFPMIALDKYRWEKMLNGGKK